jgi:hypothetical protein
MRGIGKEKTRKLIYAQKYLDQNMEEMLRTTSSMCHTIMLCTYNCLLLLSFHNLLPFQAPWLEVVLEVVLDWYRVHYLHP